MNQDTNSSSVPKSDILNNNAQVNHSPRIRDRKELNFNKINHTEYTNNKFPTFKPENNPSSIFGKEGNTRPLGNNMPLTNYNLGNIINNEIGVFNNNFKYPYKDKAIFEK